MKGIWLAQPVQSPSLMKIGVIYSAVGLADRFIPSRDWTMKRDLAYLYIFSHRIITQCHGSHSSANAISSFYGKWGQFREVKPSTPGNISGDKRSMVLNLRLWSPSPILFPEPTTMSLKKVHLQLLLTVRGPLKYIFSLTEHCFLVTDLLPHMYKAPSK